MDQEYDLLFYKTASGKKVVNEFIYSLDTRSATKVHKMLRLLRKHGLSLLLISQVKKIHQHPDIFELRINTAKHIRFLFISLDPHRFIILHVFIKKTQKTPLREIQLSINRAKEFI